MRRMQPHEGSTRSNRILLVGNIYWSRGQRREDLRGFRFHCPGRIHEKRQYHRKIALRTVTRSFFCCALTLNSVLLKDKIQTNKMLNEQTESIAQLPTDRCHLQLPRTHIHPTDKVVLNLGAILVLGPTKACFIRVRNRKLTRVGSICVPFGILPDFEKNRVREIQWQ